MVIQRSQTPYYLRLCLLQILWILINQPVGERENRTAVGGFCGSNTYMITSVHLPLARTQLWGRTSVWERPWNRVELSCQEGKEMNFGKCIRHYAIFFFASRHEIWTLAVGHQRLTLHQHILPPHHEQWLKVWEKCGLHQFFLSILFPPITVCGCLVAVLGNSVKVAVFRKQ